MSIFWKTSCLLLLLSYGCEEKKVAPAACSPKEAVTQTAQEKKEESPSVPTNAAPILADHKNERGSADAAPETKPAEPAPTMAMSARVVPEPVKYDHDEMTKEIFDNKASQEEAKDDDLKRIKEVALKRLQAKTAALAIEAGETEGRDLKKGEALYVKGRIQGNKGRFQSARDLYLASCQAGFSEGCHKFAWHEEQSGNKANAHQFYRMACDSGLGKSCNNLAFHFEQVKDWDKALDFYANACMKKHEPSCLNLKRLREEMKAH